LAVRPLTAPPPGPTPRCSVTASLQSYCTLALAVRDQLAGSDRLGGEHSEQVEVRGLFVLERADFVPGTAHEAEHLEAVRALDHAQRAVDLLAYGVGRRRDRGLAGQFGEDAPDSGPGLRRPAAAATPTRATVAVRGRRRKTPG